MTAPRWLPRFSRIRLAPRIAVVVLLTMAMTLLLDAAIGMALRSTGPRAVDERSLVRQAMQLRADLAARPRAQRAAAVERAARERKLDFALLDTARRDGAPPLADLIETMRARLAERTPDHDVAYAVSINVLPDGPGRGVRQVTVVVPTPGAERAEILSVAARPFADGSSTMIATVPAERLADAPTAGPTFPLPVAFAPTLSVPAPLVAYPWAQTQPLATLVAAPSAAPTAAPVQAMMPLQPASLALTTAPSMDLRLSDYAAPVARTRPQANDAPRIAPAFLEGLRIEPSLPRMSVALELPDGQWLLASPGKPNPLWLQQLFKLAGVVLLLLLVAVLSMRTARSFLRPLTELAQAAERLGREREPTPIEGMTIPEYAAIAGKFNDMQMRLKRFVDDRTHQLAAISHDLRTPLTRLRMRLETLDIEEIQRQRSVEDIREMNAMVDAVMELFRGDGPGAAETLVDVDLGALAQALTDDLIEQALPVRFEDGDVSGAGEPVLAKGQPMALRRVLGNLIGNAVRYGGSAEVRVGRDSQGVWLRVTDPGPGIPADKLEAVFEPFYRLEDSRNRHTGGAGLGLYIARELTLRQRGSLTLSNRPEGGLVAELRLTTS